jgi:NAD(P)-dependent dehydrogenase (short-subunit alcohol dehydrogenase family)
LGTLWCAQTSTFSVRGAIAYRRVIAGEIGAALAVHVDVSDPVSVDALARQAIETFGTVLVPDGRRAPRGDRGGLP